MRPQPVTPSTTALLGITAASFAQTINGYASAKRLFLTRSLARLMGYLPGLDEDQEAGLGALVSWLSTMAIADAELAAIPFDDLDVPAVADRAAKLSAARDFADEQLRVIIQHVTPATITTLVRAVEMLAVAALARTERTLH